METASLAPVLPAGIAALGRSLSDPKVVRIAQSLNLNLRDPVTLRKVLTETKKYLLSSTLVGLRQEQLPADEAVPGQSRYVRDALRTYRGIAAMV